MGRKQKLVSDVHEIEEEFTESEEEDEMVNIEVEEEKIWDRALNFIIAFSDYRKEYSLDIGEKLRIPDVEQYVFEMWEKYEKK